MTNSININVSVHTKHLRHRCHQHHGELAEEDDKGLVDMLTRRRRDDERMQRRRRLFAEDERRRMRAYGTDEEDVAEENEDGLGEGEEEDDEDGGAGVAMSRIRPRTYSLPATQFYRLARQHAPPLSQLPNSRSGWNDVYTCPVRCFSRTTKGVVNRGDSVRKCSLSSLLSSHSSHSAMAETPSLDDPTLDPQGQGQSPGPPGQDQGRCGGVGVSAGAHGGTLAPAYYRVAVLGTTEVGKSALVRQFMSSEYLGTYGDSCGEYSYEV